jgi:hypothetical protein
MKETIPILCIVRLALVVRGICALEKQSTSVNQKSIVNDHAQNIKQITC